MFFISVYATGIIRRRADHSNFENEFIMENSKQKIDSFLNMKMLAIFNAYKLIV